MQGQEGEERAGPWRCEVLCCLLPSLASSGGKKEENGYPAGKTQPSHSAVTKIDCALGVWPMLSRFAFGARSDVLVYDAALFGEAGPNVCSFRRLTSEASLIGGRRP